MQKKEPENMTPEELGKVFPVMLVEPNPEWPGLYKKEEADIIKILGPGNIIRIEHIGSTAVPNLLSKPTIDILIEIPEDSDNEKIINGLKSIGYHYIYRPENPPPHMMFAKGYTKDGFRGQAYHVHVRYSGDWDEIYFRDYLIKNPLVAANYAALKQELEEKYKNDREAYTDGKTDFVKRITALARKEK
jgi:GrpB-like predicted nucleotidyltransferase (UPF0157 family)